MDDNQAAPDKLSAVTDAIGSRSWLRRHAAAFCIVLALSLLANFVMSDGGWSVWPLYAWGLLLTVHFFYVRALNVSDEWVQERTDDLRMRSYDFDHIRDIKQRVVDDDFSVRPSDERDK
ncbi:MAG: 2TM domain-containing protein [Gammaproteobacteria bacterium]